ncbi:uncharacterized protein DUF4249 [Gillisia mitskevichiae]|uniref:Uncharacterized protein DUF4249 n=1 Tax=Gillisia mitskevichiae TaxID=270921 RepID=A0A495PJ92_9FLAO|nr:DUF4249 family protein [Gillisia mitskevichiae]RKS50791.1 uncharacterized protein DUF4249 [Gillisia mitskevichiae]
MKLLNNISVLILLLFCFSCEEVVDIDLQESKPRLVVEASMIWEKDSTGNLQIINLSTTTPYFNSEYSPARDASIIITTSSGETFNFLEENPGIYVNSNFLPALYQEYEITIIYEDEKYTGRETMIPVVHLEKVEQTLNGGFSGDEIELKAYYTDPVEIPNYYLFKFLYEDLSLQIYNDEFTNGNRTFAYFSDEDLAIGDTVNFEIQGISERFYEYLYILSSQAGESNGGPFQTQPTTVRGNIINESNPDNFAFGYFRLSQSDNLEYTIQ